MNDRGRVNAVFQQRLADFHGLLRAFKHQRDDRLADRVPGVQPGGLGFVKEQLGNALEAGNAVRLRLQYVQRGLRSGDRGR